MPGNVPNGDNQRTILIGDSAVPGRDFTDAALGDALHPYASLGGAVCFNDAAPPDCVAWGPFDPFGNGQILAPGPGAPVLPAGIPDGSSITRSIEPGCSALLEASDGTDESAADFEQTSPTPRPNAVEPTEHDCEPDLSTSAKKMQKAGKKFVVKATCSDQDCAAVATGKVKTKGGKSSATASKTFKLKKTSKTLVRGESTKLKLKLSKGKSKKLKKAVKKGAKGNVKLTVKASAPDAEFDPTVSKEKSKLKK